MSDIYDPADRIAAELDVPQARVRVVAELLAAGASVPFIARYRKEQTGGLDEVQIRAVEEKRAYYLELDERRRAILAEIDKQGKLTPELQQKIDRCWVKSELEDLYLPYKPKRRTRAMIARERGLEPLAARILLQEDGGKPLDEARAFVDAAREVPDEAAALAGARDIVAEVVSERPDVRALVRSVYQTEGILTCEAVPDKTTGPTKFETYYTFSERLTPLPSHRFLATRRGENEGVLRASIEVDARSLADRIAHVMLLRKSSPWARELAAAVEDSLARLLGPSITTEVRVELKLAADREAASVFAENLRRLLLQPPLGRKVVLGIDPGQRTGCKCVIVDDTGTLRHHTLINLVQGEASTQRAKQIVSELLATYQPYAIAVGNGTHGRETADFCRDLLKETGRSCIVVLVNESGASVYSASDVAREEFPDLDLTVRGAVSIARRLQDPLAELVKIDPKAIGVGQYQHDVFQPLLVRKIDDVVESCVNAVGVELNTASAPLLARVAGVGPSLAKKIVQSRADGGAFPSRQALFRVRGFGPKAFEQCAGFVRIRGGEHPLDQSAVHPERYALVEQIARDLGAPLSALVGNAALVGTIDWSRYRSAEVGDPTLEDIRAELLKPGRDPRETFLPPEFRDDVRKIEDLAVGMALEGVVTNVTAFGAFVDVGVHQDGLVHISQLADRFVKDPHEVVRVGDKVKVRVLEVDLPRKRIALTCKSAAGAGPSVAPPPRAAAPRPGAPSSRYGAPSGRPAAPSGKPGAPSGRPGAPSAKPPQPSTFSNRPFAHLVKK